MTPKESRQSFLDSAQVVMTYLLREPVKQAVREGLREERVAVRQTEPADETAESNGSGGSRLLISIVLLAVGGAGYYLYRKGTSSVGWSTDAETRTYDHDDEPSRSDDYESDIGSATSTR
jgi:hypothetical protein